MHAESRFAASQFKESWWGRHTTRHRRRRRVSSACVHATRTRSDKRTHFLKPTADDQALGKFLSAQNLTSQQCDEKLQQSHVASSWRSEGTGRGHKLGNAQRTAEGWAGILSERRFNSTSSALPPCCSTSQKLPSNDYHILWRQHSLAESPPGRVGLLEPTTTRERPMHAES